MVLRALPMDAHGDLVAASFEFIFYQKKYNPTCILPLTLLFVFNP